MKSLTLQDLFLQPQAVELKSGEKTMKVFIRLLTQVEKELCQASARGQSRRLRRTLEDKNSEEHQTLILDELDGYGIEQLRTLWINAKLIDRAVTINQKTLEDRDLTFVPEPEGNDVTGSQMEKYENLVEDIEEQREESVNKAIESARKQLVEEVKKVTKKKLTEEAMPMLIDTLCTQAWSREFAAAMISHGTFLDAEFKKPAFKTVDEVRKLQPQFLKQLADAHYGLMLEPEALKPSGGEQN